MPQVIKKDGVYQIVNTPGVTVQKSSGSKKGTSAASKSATAKNLNELSNLLEFAKSKGFDKQATEAEDRNKLGFLQRLGHVFSAFETGNAVHEKLFNNESYWANYANDIKSDLTAAFTGNIQREEPKKTYKDILMGFGAKDTPGKIDPVDVAGLAGDIVIDPINFIGGFLGKGAVKGGKVIAKPLLKVKSLKNVYESAQDLFKPFAKIERIGELGDAYKNTYTNYVKSTRSKISDFSDEVVKRYKNVKKATEMKTPGVKIGTAIETGVKTGNELLDETLDYIVKTQEAMAKAENKAGILTAKLPNYMHHMLTSEARNYMKKGGDFKQFIKPIRVKLGAAKERKLGGIATEINKAYKEKLGFNLFEEDVFKAFQKRGIDNLTAIGTLDFMNSVSKKFGKAVDADFIDDVGLRWVEPKAKQLKGIRVPAPIADHLDEVNKVLTNDESTNAFLRVFDKVQNMWKGSVTGYFPSFHTRNAIGGMFNNWIGGVNNPLRYVQADNLLKGKEGKLIGKNKNYNYDEIRELMKQHGVTGQTGILDVAEYLRKEVDPTVLDRIKNSPQMVMGYTEDRLRTTMFIDSLKKGYSPEDAAKRVFKFHFDYMPEAFTPFEKNIAKRLIPFYTWTKNNIPLQLEQMLMKPGKYAGVFKTQAALGMNAEDEANKYLPPWLKERFSIKATDGGYISGFGLPLEEMTEKLSNPLRGIGTSLSPLVKTPIEQLTGKNIFKDRLIAEDNSGKAYRNAPKPIKDLLNYKEHTSKSGGTYYTVDPDKKYWLELVGSRALNTAMRLMNTKEDEKNLLSIITTIKKYDYTVDEMKSWSDFNAKKNLQKLLIDAGYIGKGEYIYDID